MREAADAYNLARDGGDANAAPAVNPSSSPA
jgi:hypothetical protein